MTLSLPPQNTPVKIQVTEKAVEQVTGIATITEIAETQFEASKSIQQAVEDAQNNIEEAIKEYMNFLKRPRKGVFIPVLTQTESILILKTKAE